MSAVDFTVYSLQLQFIVLYEDKSHSLHVCCVNGLIYFLQSKKKITTDSVCSLCCEA